MTAAWTAEELERIGTAEELQIAPLGADGAPRRRGADLGRPGRRRPLRALLARDRRRLVRAAQASHAARVRAGGVERDVDVVEAGDDVNDAVDAAYRNKYGRYPAMEPMVRADAQATTLRLVPANDEPQH